MNPQDALDIVIQATAAVQANREVHEKISQALRTLEELINKKPEK